MNGRTIAALVTLATFALAPGAIAGGGPDAAALYKSKCASCHGADGKGQSPMGKKMNLRDLGSAEVQKQTDKELYAWIADGKGKMPGYKSKMSTAEIEALVAHIRAMKKK